MSTSFPLYDNLVKDLKNTPFSKEETDEFVKIVKKIDTEGSELFYALIKNYQLHNSDPTKASELPYGAKLVKGCLKFELAHIPDECKHLLLTFLRKHQQKIKEDQALTR